MNKITFILLCLLSVFSAYSQTRVVLLPLVNKSGDRLTDWVSAALPDYLYRNLKSNTELQVWDPVFVLSTDSSGWTMEKESDVIAHAERWSWTYAVGGEYSLDSSKLDLKVSIIKFKENDVKRKVMTFYGTENTFFTLCSGVLDSVLKSFAVSNEKSDKTLEKRSGSYKIKSYATYCAGYLFEMKKQLDKAYSSYMHSVNLDRYFALPYYRMALLNIKFSDISQAGEYISKASGLEPENPEIAAAKANYLNRYDTYKNAKTFINSNTRLLESSAEGIAETGRSYLLSGNYSRALSTLTRAVAKGPCNLDVDLLLGKAYMSTGNYDQAVNVFGRIVEYRPEEMKYYSFLGAAYRKAGRLMESSNLLTRLIEREPDDISLVVNLSNTYFRLGWYKKAKQLLLKANTMEKGFSEVLINLGVLYWYTGKKDSAIAVFSRAEDMGADVQGALNNIANIYLMEGSERDALKYYKKSLEYGRNNEKVLYNVGMFYYSAGKIEKAFSYFDEILMLTPGREDILLLQADIAEKLGRDKDAELYYKKILDTKPHHKKTIKKLVELLKDKGRFKEAVDYIEDFLKLFPGDRGFILLLADTYLEMDWNQVAIMKYKDMLKMEEFRGDPVCYLGLGRACYGLAKKRKGGLFEKAVYYLTEASRLAPGDPEPEILMGIIYKDHIKNKDKASDHFKTALNRTVKEKQKEKIRALMNE